MTVIPGCAPLIEAHETVPVIYEKVGFICGAPYSDTRFAHARACPRRGKPFIRVVLTEFGASYLCAGCHRAWDVLSGWGKLDGERRLSRKPDWWGWQLAEGLAAKQEGKSSLWVQEWGDGTAHLQVGRVIRCRMEEMYRPFPAKTDARRCKLCSRTQARPR